MRLSNHQKDATWDIWTALVSRGLAPGYGASRRVIFSLLWKQWSLSSQLRVFLWKNKNMFMFGGCMEDIHGYLFLKRSLKHSSYLADRNPPPSLALQLRDLPWSPLWCISWHSWDPGRGGWSGLCSELPPYERGDLSRSMYFLQSWFLHLWTRRTCTMVFF